MKGLQTLLFLCVAASVAFAQNKDEKGNQGNTRFLGGLLGGILGGGSRPGLGGGFRPGIGGGFRPGFGGGFGGVNPGFGGGFGGVNPGFGGGFGSGFGGSFSGIGGGFGGGASQTCRRWCRTPQGQAYCCEGNNEPDTLPFVKPGQCPPVRPACPPTRAFAPPQPCSNDSKCRGVDKCCFDTCLQQHVCKPPVGSSPFGFGR